MFAAPDSPLLVPFDGSFRTGDAATGPPGGTRPKKRLAAAIPRLPDLQRRLVADKRHALLLVFQGMDAAGKDGTIRAVLQGMDPSAFAVHRFGKPTRTELAHDFLWRTTRCLPARGRIGVFNRSQYEEVLVVRVHPEILERQQLPPSPDPDKLWRQRLASIRRQERHLAHNGTVILKFWLNVSRDEQRRRFLRRLDEPDKHWKFNPDDVTERGHWERYMHCYEAALNATARPWAPWYAIPADNKPFMRAAVAEIVVAALASLDLRFPRAAPSAAGQLQHWRESLRES